MTSHVVRGLTYGVAQGPIALLSRPLSLWGGLHLEDGTICDVNHPEHGRHLAGRILAMRSARGSSSSSSALVEAARRGTAPAAIILSTPDPILVIGALVAAELYGILLPIVILDEDCWEEIPEKGHAAIAASKQKSSVRFS